MNEGDGGDGGGVGPVSRSRRFFKLAGMTASVVGRYARTGLEAALSSPAEAARKRAEAHLRSGERIARTLGELKGAVMKVGQMASLASGVLPPEVTSALSVLRKEAPPMPYRTIAAQIERELGQPPDALFARFDRQPWAAASIGQVHRAVTAEGREVVVKVQYPGVDESCDSDLAQLKLALRASGMIPGRKRVLDGLFAELRDRLHEELDYRQEAANLHLARWLHGGHPFLVIPEVIEERSAQRVLTLVYEPGDSLDQAAAYPQAVRDQIGINLFHMVCSELFRFHTVHADPNPANFAFRPDGTVVVYDWGCVKRVPPPIVSAYRQVLRCGLVDDYDGVEQGMLALGARVPDGPPVEAAFYKIWRDILIRPILPDRDYDFGAATMHDEVLRQVPGMLRHLGSFQPPTDVVLVDRVLVGHYWNLHQLGSRGRLGDLLPPYLDPALDPAPPPAAT